MDSVFLAATGPLLTAVGSIILGIRLEATIESIRTGIRLNQEAMERLMAGDGEAERLRVGHERVQQALGKGKQALVWGFSLIALGGMVNALSHFID